MQDVRYAARSWRTAPGLALVAALTMALGIGATTAAFSVVDATLLHPLPYPQADRLVSVVDDLPGVASYDVGLSQPEWLDLERLGIFDHIALAWFDENNLTGASRPAQVRLMSVTPNYFAVLGVAPQLGRTFPVENRLPGYLGEIVISDGLWRRDFGGDPHILERSIRLDTDLYRIVGVMPARFHAPGRTVDERNVDVWAATSFYGPPLSYQPPRRVRNIPTAIARLTPGLTRTAGQGRIDALVGDLRRQYPADYPDRSGWTVRLVPLQDTVVGDVRPSLISDVLCRGPRARNGVRERRQPPARSREHTTPRVRGAASDRRGGESPDPTSADGESVPFDNRRRRRHRVSLCREGIARSRHSGRTTPAERHHDELERAAVCGPCDVRVRCHLRLCAGNCRSPA